MAPQSRVFATARVAFAGRFQFTGPMSLTGGLNQPAPPHLTQLLIMPLQEHRVRSSIRHLLHRNAFRQIPRLIHIATPTDGDVVGEELQGDYF